MGEAHRCDVSILRARLGGRECRERAGALEDRDSLAIKDIVSGSGMPNIMMRILSLVSRDGRAHDH